jgi:uncharacterized protein
MAKINNAKMLESRKNAFKNLGIDYNKRVILSLDGGGMRGILTVQLLKKLEEVAGIPCYELFDMVAGTSTGGIIAGLIVNGFTAHEIEEKYTRLVSEVFDKRVLGDRFVNPPKFSKSKYRKLLFKEFENITLAQSCAKHSIDLMITAHDMSASEETFFSCFKQKDDTCHGTYKDVLLRAVMEATMSAPTYFNPLERFVDGGTTTYNNPALSAFIEAISYSYPKNKEKQSLYDISKMCIFSFGTGISKQFIKPDKTISISGLDIKFWLEWLMTETGQDASAMQVNTLRSPMINKIIDFRRFQISLDPISIKKIPNTDTLDPHKYKSKWLHDLDEAILRNIDMSDITRFDLMKIIGEQMANYIVQSGNGFKKDLVDLYNNDLLVILSGDIDRIKKQMSDPKWLDSFHV